MPKDFKAMERKGPSGNSAAREALRSRMGHPTKLPLHEVQSNPQNPRYGYDDPETQELAATLRRVGQLQPAVVVARTQYVGAYPDQEAVLGPEPWVVIAGNRRLAAARLADRPSLDVRVASDLTTREEFEERMLIENLQRKDLPPLLEAAVLQRLLRQPGQTTRSVGEAIGRSHAYVQQRVDLLDMIAEFRKLFEDGAINIKLGRQLAVLPEEQQRAIFATGPPFAPPARRNVAEHAAEDGTASGTSGDQPGNRVTTEPHHDPAVQTSPDGGGTAGNPVTTETQTASDRRAPLAEAMPSADNGGEAGNPVTTAGTGAASTDVGADQGHAAGRAEDNGRRTPPAPLHDLDATRTSVGQWLDSALTELDRALPSGSDGELGQALAAARRHIEEARAALGRATAPAH